MKTIAIYVDAWMKRRGDLLDVSYQQERTKRRGRAVHERGDEGGWKKNGEGSGSQTCKKSGKEGGPQCEENLLRVWGAGRGLDTEMWVKTCEGNLGLVRGWGNT